MLQGCWWVVERAGHRQTRISSLCVTWRNGRHGTESEVKQKDWTRNQKEKTG
jgi:hypothetical protein